MSSWPIPTSAEVYAAHFVETQMRSGWVRRLLVACCLRLARDGLALAGLDVGESGRAAGLLTETGAPAAGQGGLAHLDQVAVEGSRR